MTAAQTLESYRLVGRSGLRVSPLALGTMMFGSKCPWGTDREEARRIFDAYINLGGNFIDTANRYADGDSEQLIGTFAAGQRDRLVIATKYTLPSRVNDPNSGGNHRKSLIGSVESSLRRLASGYIDLLYLHAWDATTPPEEVLRALDDLIRAGKVLYIGISNTPAWQVARMQAIAELRGWSPLIALQIPYNLVERSVERELIPMAREMGLGVIPWSPLASGILTGKYGRVHGDFKDEDAPHPSRRNQLIEVGTLSDRSLAIAAVLNELSVEIHKSPSQIAIAWILQRSGITSPIIGARTLKQFQENIGALDVELTEFQRTRLDKVSAVELGFPHDYLAMWIPKTYAPGSLRTGR